MSPRLSLLLAALFLALPALAHAEPLPYPTKPWIKPSTRNSSVIATSPTGARMDVKPVLWNRATPAAPVYLAADTSQDRAEWRDLSTKPSHWIRSTAPETAPGCTLVACDRSCGCHHG